MTSPTRRLIYVPEELSSRWDLLIKHYPDTVLSHLVQSAMEKEIQHLANVDEEFHRDLERLNERRAS